MLSSVQRTLNKECQIKQPAHGCVDMVTTLLIKDKTCILFTIFSVGTVCMPFIATFNFCEL